MTTLSYLYQLQNVTYSELASNFARVNVIDPDDAGLSKTQLTTLENGGRTIFSYLSIGEAEDYRDYWENGNWGAHKPSFVLGQNPDWPGNYSVKFWDPQWQTIMLNKVTALAAQGYNGVYLDIVDAYQVQQVITAYNKDTSSNKSGNIRTDMENFVIKLSDAAKAINPNFKIIPQNAVELLAMPGTDNVPNTHYLHAIDGVGKEDTFYNDNAVPGWTAEDVKLLDLAIANGKFVLAIDYPTDPAKQADFINKALAHGYIPFVGDRDLDNLGVAADATIPGKISPHAFDFLNLHAVTGTENTETLYGTADADNINGLGGDDHIYAAAGNDVVHGGEGHDLMTGDEGNDVLSGDNGDDKLYGWTGDDVLSGGTGNDFVAGDDGNDVVHGDDGNDTLYGWTGNDTMEGGAGHDYLFGDAGADSLSGGDGNDTMYGWTENDTMDGGNGNDIIFGDDGNDSITGGLGDDTLFGWTGNDTINTGDGNNVASGEQGDDAITGGAGNDSIYGGDGNDTLIGNAGNDYFEGGAGNDSIVGGAGVDFMYGGAGADTFVFNKTDSTFSATDSIQDFENGIDHLKIIGLTGFGDGSGTTVGVQYNANGDTVIFNTASHFAVVLVGHHQMAAGDFVFAAS